MSFSPTIEGRFRLTFRLYDLNKDGYLSSKDQYELIENLTRLHKTDAEETAKKEADQQWAMVEKLYLKKEVTEEEYVSMMRYLFVSDFATLRKRVFKNYETSFNLIDHDKDSKISLDELITYYACFNVTDTDRVEKIFKKLDLDSDGFVTRDEWTLAQMDCYSREDPEYDFGFMLNFSSPVPENCSRPTGRLTPNLLKRYKKAFRFYDINKDGVHTIDDYFLVCDTLCTLHNGLEEERLAVRHRAAEWWKKLEAMAVDGKITEEHFVYGVITYLVTDFENMRQDVLISYRRWFDLGDQNHDGFMSEDEFLKFYTACNATDTDRVKTIFRQVDLDDDGFISEEEWILANLDYWTRDDSTYDYGFLYDVE